MFAGGMSELGVMLSLGIIECLAVKVGLCESAAVCER
jgi:hypothetical protein